jgi:hypothetical protein
MISRQYLLKTLSTSADIEGIEYSSYAILANVGYMVSFALHHAIRSNEKSAS